MEKIKKVYFVRKENAVKVVKAKKSRRKKAIGGDKTRITESSIVDELIGTHL